MSLNSAIEWTDATWNPIRARPRPGEKLVGDPGWKSARPGGKPGWYCEHHSEGCRFCYAEVMNRRLGTGIDFQRQNRDRVHIFLDDDMLLVPLKWRKPRMIFVCSMTDLFADFVSDEWIDRVFAVMALCPQHTFQVLTKRAERMRAYFDKYDKGHKIIGICWSMLGMMPKYNHGDILHRSWPLPNVWLGISCERQQEADERIPLLLQTQAAVRFISAEPLLGPINLKRIKVADLGWQDVLEGWRDCKDYPGRENILAWVIVGGESGPNARPMHPDWARSIRDQCAAAGVPFFFKQWGEHAPRWPGDRSDGVAMERVGKKRAGRLLDGREHNDFPVIDSSAPQRGSPSPESKTAEASA